MLPRAYRLRRNRDFQMVYRARKSWASPHFALYVRLRGGTISPTETARIGLVISKKVAKRAHDRNRLKRRLRAIIRTQTIPDLCSPRHPDLIFVARTGAHEVDFSGLAGEVGMLCRQAGLN